MKRGFTQTLMMAAIVIMAAQAMAMAPVISDIPSPVVGDQETATPANTFVYPDAIDLSTYVSDTQTTDPTQIKWYYEVVGAGEHFYSINNAPEIVAADPVMTDPSAVAATKIIAGPGALSTETTGTKVLNQTKITIRNKHLSPIGGPNKAPDGDQTQDVILYASDGELTSHTTVTFFTAAGETDHLSGGIPQLLPVADRDMTSSTNGFTWGGNGTIAHAQNTNGVCITAGASGDSGGAYTSPFGDFKLIDNAAYRIRMVVNGTMTTVPQVPIWDILIDNAWVDRSGSTPVGHGRMAYGADFWMWSGNGGTNANVQFVKGDTTFDFWYTPAAVKSTAWKTGTFAPSVTDDQRNGMITFRMIDYKVTNAAINAQAAQGTLCLKSMTIEHVDIDDLTVDPTVVWKSSGWTLGTDWYVVWTGTNGVRNDTETAASDGITIKATSGTTQNADFYAALCPGNGALGANVAAVQDDYPCSLEAKTLYKITYKLSAPTNATSPMDAFWLSTNPLSSEMIGESYMVPGAVKDGAPTAQVQDFVTFFYSNFGTDPNGPDYMKFWRPYIAMTNNSTALGTPGQTGNAKTGAIKVSEIKVEKVMGF